jgi:hypothetical protein
LRPPPQPTTVVSWHWEKPLTQEEETFYVGADVKLFLSSLRAATVPRALECVRLSSLKPPSIRVGLLPPNT